MSYLCLVPEGAVGKEHLTLVWCGKRYDTPAGVELFRDIVASWLPLLPIEGFVYGHDTHFGKPVALIALPHAIHIRRDSLSTLSASDLPYDWRPHITQVKHHKRHTGDRVVFDRVEWRP